MYFIITYFYGLTTHVTVCMCHTELKGYFLTYLLLGKITVNFHGRHNNRCP